MTLFLKHKTDIHN